MTQAVNVNERLVAATHDGAFHADDLMGAAILNSTFTEVDIVRTRDKDVLSDTPLVFDVGGEYNPKAHRFDHHQKGGAGQRSNQVPYASAGLLWKEYGLNVVRDIASQYDVDFPQLALRVDGALIEHVDAHDNGVATADNNTLTFPKSLALLNETYGASREQQDKSFEDATTIAQAFLTKIVLHEASKMVTEKIVRSSYQGGPILELAEDIPWEEVVVNELEEVLLVLVPRRNQVSLKTVPLHVGSFVSRQSLPSSWAGLSGDDLAKATGVQGAIFCHNGRFTAAASSIESAQALASLALALGPDK